MEPHLLLLRFSALGDVAMAVPVVRQLAYERPACRLTVVTRRGWEPLFAGLPPQVHVEGVALADYAGLHGLERLYRRLRALRPDAVADLHDVLRTKYLRLRFALAGVPVAHIDKGRREKRLLCARGALLSHPLKSTVARYADVLAAVGLPLKGAPLAPIEPRPAPSPALLPLLGDDGEQRIGIAPFARHKGKVYPLHLMRQVIDGLLSSEPARRILLFGGGAAEKRVCEELAAEYGRVVSLVGRASLSDELAVIGRLHLMISMDSANMHLAAMQGVPVVSVWGSTHPFAGFAPWGQPADRMVGLALPCRPCSVYGNRPCRRGDYACLNDITPQSIVERSNSLLSVSS